MKSLACCSALIICLVVTAQINARESDEDKRTNVEITPTVRFTTISGDEKKFRKDTWADNGWSGGFENLTIDHDFGNDWQGHLEGRVLVDEEDYKLKLAVENDAVGFFRVSYNQFRKYYDDSGGFFRPFSLPGLHLDQDLHLDIGDLIVEGGVTLPDLPKLTLGYEHRFKDGIKSMIEWGSVTERIKGTNITRKIYPATKEIDEHVNIYTLSIEHDIKNIHIRDELRYEQYDFAANRLDDAQLTLPASIPAKIVTTDETYEHNSMMNTLRLESHVNDQVYWSLGYLLTSLDGDAGFRLDTIPFNANRDRNWFTRDVDLHQDTHVVNANLMLGPNRGFVIYGGLQSETRETDGRTDAILAERTSSGIAVPEVFIDTNNQTDEFQEHLGLRYVGIPYTTIYSEGKWIQGDITLSERELEDKMITLERRTDTDIHRDQYRIGFNTSPFAGSTFGGGYRRLIRENDYDHVLDFEENNNGILVPLEGYSAFIEYQEIITDEITGKLSLRPTSRITLLLTYRWVETDFASKHDPVTASSIPAGSLRTGEYDADIYSFSVTVTPLQMMYLTGMFSWTDSRTLAFINQANTVTTYHGDTYTMSGVLGFALRADTNISLQYALSLADNFTNITLSGLPLGTSYQQHETFMTITHDISKNLSVQVRYGFAYYDEDSNGGIDDYQAHFASMNWTFKF